MPAPPASTGPLSITASDPRGRSPIRALVDRLVATDADAATLDQCRALIADADRVARWAAATRASLANALRRRQLEHHTVEPTTVEPVELGGASVRPVDPPPPLAPAPSGTRSTRGEARDAKTERGVALLPAFGDALAGGEITVEHVHALDTLTHRDIARSQVPTLLAIARAKTAEEFARWLTDWDADLDRRAGIDRSARQGAARQVRFWEGRDGCGELRATLPPAAFDALRRSLYALDAQLARDGRHDPTANVRQRLADALVEMMHRANERPARPRRAGADARAEPDHDAPGGSLRTAVVVTIALRDLLEGTGLGHTVDGRPIDVAEVRKLAAREHVIPAVLDADGSVLDLGRARRYATDAQWLALVVGHRGCALCDDPLGPVDAHHITPWADGGTTDLHNLCPACRREHRQIHAGEIHLARDPGGDLRATRADGTDLAVRRRGSRDRDRETPPG